MRFDCLPKYFPVRLIFFNLHVESLVKILLQSVVRNIIRDVGHFGRNACSSHVLHHLKKEICETLSLKASMKTGFFEGFDLR